VGGGAPSERQRVRRDSTSTQTGRSSTTSAPAATARHLSARRSCCHTILPLHARQSEVPRSTAPTCREPIYRTSTSRRTTRSRIMRVAFKSTVLAVARAYGTLLCPSICLSSVCYICIVAKRYVNTPNHGALQTVALRIVPKPLHG